MERRWRFVYDDKNRGRAGRWAWQVHVNRRLKMASLCAHATLEDCIGHARESGFSFSQSYDIVFARAQAADAGV